MQMPNHAAARDYEVGIGIVGLGTVGQAFLRQLEAQATGIRQRYGINLRVVSIAVKDPGKPRAGIRTEKYEMTQDARAAARDPRVKVLVEVMGGTGLAREVVSEALANGKLAVTANKALLEKHGTELARIARENGAGLYFEASVAGGIPIIRTLKEYSGDQTVNAIRGIINGTTNYILSSMETGKDFDTALREAQQRGFAEADPTADLDGHDAASKIGILASLAFGCRPRIDGMQVIPLRVTREDVEFAGNNGYTIKYVAHASRTGNEIDAGVWPTLVDKGNTLAAVRGPDNMITIDGDKTKPLTLHGAGAGGEPTGHAVLADVVSAAIDSRSGERPDPNVFPDLPARLTPPNQVFGRYCFSIPTAHKPGRLQSIAGVMEANGINIKQVNQTTPQEGSPEPAVVHILTEKTTLENAQNALAQLGKENPAKPRIFQVQD